MISDKTRNRLNPLIGIRELDRVRDTALLTHLSSKWVDEIGRMYWSAPDTNGRIIALVIDDVAWLQATLRKRDNTWVVNGIGVRKEQLHQGFGRELLDVLIPPIEAKCLEENDLGTLFWQRRGFQLVNTEKTSVDKRLLTWRKES